MDPAPPDTEYSRWISTGLGRYGGPVYSIQRFTFTSGNYYTKGHEVPPFYNLYHHGFSVAEDFDSFEAACERADKHNRNRV
jgi:hypothetical protein